MNMIIKAWESSSGSQSDLTGKSYRDSHIISDVTDEMRLEDKGSHSM